MALGQDSPSGGHAKPGPCIALGCAIRPESCQARCRRAVTVRQTGQPATRQRIEDGSVRLPLVFVDMREADPALLTRMDIRSALDTETSGPRRDLLPVQVGDLAARTKLDEVAAIIATRAREGRVGTKPAPVLAASKWRHGRRPAAALALPERVMYRAAASLLGDGLADERDKNDHAAFVNAPVQNGDGFVIVTDLANYYSSVQIDRLADVLLSRTGEWSTVTLLRDFLRAISPSVGGLPQGNYASDRLADTYADTLLRKLRRRGLSAWRYSDDFRIGASSYQNAINALEVFDEMRRSARWAFLSTSAKHT